MKKIKLYKYTPHIEIFINNPAFRLTQSWNLNDPFELKPNDLTNKTFSLKHEGLHGLCASALEEVNDLACRSQHGVVSLSETFSNPLMWAHYADNHKGGVIEFTFELEVMSMGRYKEYGLFNNLLDADYIFDQVKYRRFRNPEDEMESKTEMFERVAFTKADYWSYEQEHRFVINLEHTDNAFITNNPYSISLIEYYEKAMDVKVPYSMDDTKITFDACDESKSFLMYLDAFDFQDLNLLRFIEVNPMAVTGVYLGVNMSKDIKKRIISNSSGELDKFTSLNDKIIEVRLDPDRFDLLY